MFSASRAPNRCVLQRFSVSETRKRCKTQRFGALDAEHAVFSQFLQSNGRKNVKTQRCQHPGLQHVVFYGVFWFRKQKKRCKTQRFGALDAENAVFSYFFTASDTKTYWKQNTFQSFHWLSTFFNFSPSFPLKCPCNIGACNTGAVVLELYYWSCSTGALVLGPVVLGL